MLQNQGVAGNGSAQPAPAFGAEAAVLLDGSAAAGAGGGLRQGAEEEIVGCDLKLAAQGGQLHGVGGGQAALPAEHIVFGNLDGLGQFLGRQAGLLPGLGDALGDIHKINLLYRSLYYHFTIS